MLHKLSMALNSPASSATEPVYGPDGSIIGLQRKQAGYINDTASTPPPVKSPRVPAPGPSTKPPKLDAGDDAGSTLGAGTAAQGGSQAASGGGEKAAADVSEGMLPLLAGGVGGTAAWLGAKKIVNPLIKQQEAATEAAIKKLQAKKAMLGGLQKTVPIGAAAAGALLLAAMAAIKARKNTQREMMGMDPQFRPYDPMRQGFYPEEQVQFNPGGVRP